MTQSFLGSPDESFVESPLDARNTVPWRLDVQFELKRRIIDPIIETEQLDGYIEVYMKTNLPNGKFRITVYKLKASERADNETEFLLPDAADLKKNERLDRVLKAIETQQLKIWPCDFEDADEDPQDGEAIKSLYAPVTDDDDLPWIGFSFVLYEEPDPDDYQDPYLLNTDNPDLFDEEEKPTHQDVLIIVELLGPGGIYENVYKHSKKSLILDKWKYYQYFKTNQTCIGIINAWQTVYGYPVQQPPNSGIDISNPIPVPSGTASVPGQLTVSSGPLRWRFEQILPFIMNPDGSVFGYNTVAWARVAKGYTNNYEVLSRTTWNPFDPLRCNPPYQELDIFGNILNSSWTDIDKDKTFMVESTHPALDEVEFFDKDDEDLYFDSNEEDDVSNICPRAALVNSFEQIFEFAQPYEPDPNYPYYNEVDDLDVDQLPGALFYANAKICRVHAVWTRGIIGDIDLSDFPPGMDGEPLPFKFSYILGEQDQPYLNYRYACLVEKEALPIEFIDLYVEIVQEWRSQVDFNAQVEGMPDQDISDLNEEKMERLEQTREEAVDEMAPKLEDDTYQWALDTFEPVENEFKKWVEPAGERHAPTSGDFPQISWATGYQGQNDTYNKLDDNYHVKPEEWLFFCFTI